MKKLLCLHVVLFCLRASGQAAGTGAYNFAPLQSLSFDQVNTGNLNVRFSIPLVSRAGRGLPFNYALQYEGLIWTPVTTSGVTTWQNDPNWGFQGQLNGSGTAGYLTYLALARACPRPPNTSGPYINQTVSYMKFVYHDTFGASHRFQYTITEPCPDSTNGAETVTGNGSTNDGSGYTFVNGNGWQVKRRDGTVITPVVGQQSTYNSSITDSNGNQITSNGDVLTDTLGVNALTIGGSGTPGSPRTFTYPVALQADGKPAE